MTATITKTLTSAYIFFTKGEKLSITHRGVRFAVGLVEPVLSISGSLERSWQIGLNVLSICVLITSFTGVCFAGKIASSVKQFFIKRLQSQTQHAKLSTCCHHRSNN